SSIQTGEASVAAPRSFCEMPDVFGREVAEIARLLAETFDERRTQARAEALLILGNEKAMASSLGHYPPAVEQAVAAARGRLEAAGVDWRGAPIEARYACVAAISQETITETRPSEETFGDQLDRI